MSVELSVPENYWLLLEKLHFLTEWIHRLVRRKTIIKIQMKKQLLLLLAIGLASLSKAQMDSTSFRVHDGAGAEMKHFIEVPTPSGSNLHMTTSWTIEAWVFIPPTASPDQMFICESYSDGATGGFVLRVNSTGQVMAYQIQNPGSSVNILSSATANLGEWNHIAATYDEDAALLSVFLNGSYSNGTPCSITSSNTNSSMYIGARGNDQHIWQPVHIDELRIWSGAKNETEIAALMNDCLSGSEANLLAYYDFETETASVMDLSGNGNNGTIQNYDAEAHEEGVFECTSAGPSNVLEESFSSDIVIYPNPSSSEVSIKSSSEIHEVIIFDALGKIVQQEATATFSVANLANGVYTFAIKSDRSTETKRFVKK